MPSHRKQLHEERVHERRHAGGWALLRIVKLRVELVQHGVERTAHKGGLPLEPFEELLVRVCSAGQCDSTGQERKGGGEHGRPWLCAASYRSRQADSPAGRAAGT